MESLRGRAGQRPAPYTRPRQRDGTPDYRTRRNDNFSSRPKYTYPPKRGYVQRMNEAPNGPHRYTQNLYKNNNNKYDAAQNFHRSVPGPYRPYNKKIQENRNQKNRTTQYRNKFENYNNRKEYYDEQRPRQVAYPRASSHHDRDVVLPSTKGPKNNRNTQNYSQKNTDRAKQNQTNNRTSHQNTDFIPAPPKLKNAIKLMYRLIRLVHHLGKVTTKVEGNQPITFQRLTNLLVNTVKPAFPAEQVNQLLEGNAKNWSYTTQLVLEQHYESLIEVTLKEIREQTDQADWPQAFEVASTWTDKNYGGKVSTDTVEQAEALITAELFEIETVTQNPTNPVTREASSPRTYAQVAATRPATPSTSPPTRFRGPPSLIPPQVSVRPKKGVQHIEVQTSPSLLTVPTSVSPPKHRGDWSFDEEDEEEVERNPLDPEVILRPIQAPVPSPRIQRITGPRRVQAVLPDHMPTISSEGPQRADMNMSPHHEVILEKEPVVSEKEPNNEESSPVAPPVQLARRGSDHSSLMSFSLYAESTEAPIRGLSPLSRFLKEGDEPPQNLDAPKETTVEIEQCEASTSHYTPQPRPRKALLEKIPLTPYTDMGRVNNAENSSETTALEGQQDNRNEEMTENLPLMIAPININEAEVTNVQISAPTNDDPTTGPTRHINTGKKMSDWSLTLNKKYVIIGDSNVSRLPTYNCPDLQVDSFPGAKLQHAANLIEKATIEVEPEKIILSFGFNNRQQRYRIAAITELQKACRAVTKRLPNTEVFFPLINFARTLPLYEQMMIEHLNNHIKKITGHIPPLPIEQFIVENDGIHWKALTAKAMLQHWKTHLNC